MWMEIYPKKDLICFAHNIRKEKINFGHKSPNESKVQPDYIWSTKNEKIAATTIESLWETL